MPCAATALGSGRTSYRHSSRHYGAALHARRLDRAPSMELAYGARHVARTAPHRGHLGGEPAGASGSGLCGPPRRPQRCIPWGDGRGCSSPLAYPGVRTRLPATPAHFIGCFFCTACTRLRNRPSKAMRSADGASKNLRIPAPKGCLARPAKAAKDVPPGRGRWDDKCTVSCGVRQFAPQLKVFQEGYELRACIAIGVAAYMVRGAPANPSKTLLRQGF